MDRRVDGEDFLVVDAGDDTAPGANDDRPVVSVIIPVYNRSQLLARTLQSVIDQSFPEWELLLVDDGSTEDPADVVATLGDDRIAILRLPENRGAPVARNTGIDNARGSLIAFLDSDDEWMPHRLESTLQFMPAEADAVLSGFVVHGGRDPVSFLPPQGAISHHDLLCGPHKWITTGQLVVRTEAVRAVRFDEALEAFQDWDLLLRLSEEHLIVGQDRVLLVKHDHEGARVFQGARRHRALLHVADKHRDRIAADADLDRSWRRKAALAHWQLGDFEATRATLTEAVRVHPADGRLRRLYRASRLGRGPFAVFLGLRYRLRTLFRRR